MKLLQIVFLTTIIALTGTLNLYAQKGNKWSAEDAAKKQTEWMTKELKLDEAQAVKVQAVNKEFFDKMFAEREKNMGNREAMQAAMKSARKVKIDKLKEVLSKEQYELYKQKLAERRGQMQGRKKGGNR